MGKLIGTRREVAAVADIFAAALSKALTSPVSGFKQRRFLHAAAREKPVQLGHFSLERGG